MVLQLPGHVEEKWHCHKLDQVRSIHHPAAVSAPPSGTFEVIFKRPLELRSVLLATQTVVGEAKQ